jgi:hypothetical protein
MCFNDEKCYKRPIRPPDKFVKPKSTNLQMSVIQDIKEFAVAQHYSVAEGGTSFLANLEKIRRKLEHRKRLKVFAES